MNRRIRLLLPIVITALVFGGTLPAAADDLEDDLQSVSRRITELTSSIGDATAERSSLAAGLRDAEARMAEVLSSISGIRVELSALELSIADREASLGAIRDVLAEQYAVLARTRDDLDEAREASIAWAREAYMSAGQSSSDIAFSATALSDVALGVEYLDRLTRDSTAAADRYAALAEREEAERREVEATEAEIEQELAALDAERATLQGTRALLEARGDELQAEFERQRQILAEVEAEIADWEGELTALEGEQASIRRLIAERAAPASTQSTAKPAAGRLVRPVPGAISSGFGPRIHPIHGTRKMHQGVDMNGALGDPIRASAAGTVILAGTKGGYGTTVMIDHGGGMVTLYAHQSKLAVARGDRVAAGEVVGYVGSTGLSTGPHLHFEVRINGTPVDPARYL